MIFLNYLYIVIGSLVVLWSAGVPILDHIDANHPKLANNLGSALIILTLASLFSLIAYGIYRGVVYSEVDLSTYVEDKEKTEEFPELRSILVEYLEDNILLRWEHKKFLEHYERAKVDKTVREIKEE